MLLSLLKLILICLPFLSILFIGFVSKLKNKYKIDVDLDKPIVPYREKIRTKVQARGKYKKQSGGHGQFGDVVIDFEPIEDQTIPYVFEEKIFGGGRREIFVRHRTQKIFPISSPKRCPLIRSCSGICIAEASLPTRPAANGNGVSEIFSAKLISVLP